MIFHRFIILLRRQEIHTRGFLRVLIAAVIAVGMAAGVGPTPPARAELAPSIVVLPAGIVAPWSAVIEGADGNLYGTTNNGGVFGTVFKMMPSGSASPVYRFPNRSDGAQTDAPVIQGMDGSLYGVTNYEGGPKRCATVFVVNTDGTGFKVLHTFDGTDGCRPYGGLVQGDDGTLYGTTTEGGPLHLGGVFKLSPDGSNFAVVHLFATTQEGYDAIGRLIQGADGRIYGTTSMGGPRGAGTIFAFKPDGSGFTTLFGFGHGSTDGGGNPRAGVTQGPDAMLYGTTWTGGQYGAGTVFKLKPDGTGFAALHQFGAASDGVNPVADVLLASDGRLYATSTGKGSIPGSVFSLKTDGSDYQVIHTFRGGASEGLTPEAGLLQASDGTLVGTTIGGPRSTSGTVYRFSLGLPRPVPTIRSFTPASGPWGTQVLIHGAYFVNATAAGFHGVSGQVNIPSAQWARTTVPTLATTGPVSITTAGGPGTRSTFTVLPTVSALSVASGKFGDRVTITGTNFTGVKSVTFNGMASSYTVNSPTQITATVPEDSASGPVVVTTADGTASHPTSFTVTSPHPSVTITSLTLTHSSKGTQALTTALNHKEKGTFTATVTAQNPGKHTVAATITFLKGGKPTGKPVTMKVGTVNGATVLTATKSFSGSKKVTSFLAQMSVALGPTHDQKSLTFKVNSKPKK